MLTTKTTLFVSIAAALTTTIAAADTIAYSPNLGDSARVAGSPPNASGNCCGIVDGTLSTGRSAGNTWSFRSALRFDDLANLSEDAQIAGATLRLFRTSAPEANDGLQNLYALQSAFSTAGLDPTCCAGDPDNQAFYQLADGIAGTTVGTPLASFIASAGYNDLDVTSVVLDWQANDWTNAFGFGLVGVENLNQSGVTYDGAFGTNPAQLVLEVFFIPEPGTLSLLTLGTLWMARCQRRRRRHVAVQKQNLAR